MMKMKRWLQSVLMSSLSLAVLAGCGGTAPADKQPAAEAPAADQSGAKKELVAVKQVSNWFAQAEHGGFYTAKLKGFYEEAGLDMTIEPGGPKIQAAQMVASGKAQFGMMNADELLIARSNGIPLVAVFATFQKSPQGLLFHKDQAIKDFSELNGREVYVTPGGGFWEYIKKKYQLDQVKEMAYTGQLTTFLANKSSITQCFITSEPFATAQEGIETGHLLIADSGYAPYGNIMVTTEQFIQEHPDVVKAYVQASIKGWEYYKENYKEILPDIQKENPDLSIEKLEYSAKTLQDLAYGGDAATAGVGSMSQERWTQLKDILVDLEIIKDLDVTKAFTNEFRN